jgi:N6-adenosine-specific RNA methylase IME4
MPTTIRSAPPTPTDEQAIVTTPQFVVTPRGLSVVGTPTFDAWMQFGERLRDMGQALSWAVGDWIAYGEERGDWGERYTQALDARVMTYESLRVAAYVARRFAWPARHRNLSWSHHKAVAKFPPDAAQRLLTMAETHNWSVAQLREQVRTLEDAERIAFHEFPIGTFGLLFADVPWAQMGDAPPADLAERVRSVAAPDSVLVMCAPDTRLADALEMIAAWGFTYRASAVWIKDLSQDGRYFRSRHELLLFATRGNAPQPADDLRPDSVFEIPEMTTVRKPDRIYEVIEEMFPRIPRVELFAARGARPGWQTLSRDRTLAQVFAATPDIVAASVLDATVAGTTPTPPIRRAARRLASTATGQP